VWLPASAGRLRETLDFRLEAEPQTQRAMPVRRMNRRVRVQENDMFSLELLSC
jgi:hypothetical protein